MRLPAEAQRARYLTFLLLLAVALVGFAHAALLPPWEGFDETAHWSYIQQLADTGHPPKYGRDGVAADVMAYPGPMPYGAEPPFEKTGRLTYRGFRLSGARSVAGGPTHYKSAGSLNWQAQHPPLYYALLVPVYRLTHDMGWVNSFFVLREVSFALAFAGFAIGVIGTAGFVRGGAGVWGGAVIAAWPFLFPEFFPEFARLGNDSLCLLLASIAWILTLRLLTGVGRWPSSLGLGVALGLGLLTKAFFLPIGAGIGLLLLGRWLQQGRRADVLGQALLAGIVALAIGGWWYLSKKLETGSWVGSDEFIRLSQSGGAAKIAQGVSAPALLRGLAVIPASFVWAGTWSLARLPEVLLLPPLLLLAVALVGYFRGLALRDLVGWAPMALAVPVLAGLVYHVFVWMAGASAVTPGWYLHILAAPLGFAIARGWTRPRLFAGLAALGVVYTLAAWAFQLSMFSGCAAKIGADKHYSLQGSACFLDVGALGAIAHPGVGLIALALGAILALVAAVMALQAYKPGRADGPVPI